MIASFHCGGSTIAVTLLVTISSWGACVQAAAPTEKRTEDRKAEEVKYVNSNAGQDPHAFAAPDGLLRTDTDFAQEERVSILVRQVTRQLEAGIRLEDISVWSVLNELAPSCRSKEVQASVSEWASLSAKQIEQPATALSGGIFEAANADYKAGAFLSASQKYRALLRNQPGHLDGRNNLALARIHMGDDLTSLVELKVLCQIEPQYLPAWLNLTLVYERLGNSAKARAAAGQSLQLQPQLPLAIFNVAWYENVEGNFAKADALLTPVQEWDVGQKYRDLYNLNKRQLATSAPSAATKAGGLTSSVSTPGFWRQGLAGICGGRSGWAPWIVALGLFVVSTLVVIGISAGIGASSQDKSNRGVVGFGAFLVLGSLWHIVYWGLPDGGWWTAMTVYILVCAAVSSAASDK